MKAYRLILLAIASMAMAAETEGQQLTTLATVEVQAPDPTPTAASDTVATTDAPAATDTVEPESSEFITDTDTGTDVGTAVGGEQSGLNVTSEADLPAEFKGQAGSEALIDEGDPPEDKSSSLQTRGWGGNNKVKYCFGPFNIYNIRIGVTCPYYTQNWARFHRRKLHVDVRVWQRKGLWNPWYKIIGNFQVTRYTHRGRECGFVRDRVSNHVIYDHCKWWQWQTMARKLTKVCLHHIRDILKHAGWPFWLVSNIVGGMFWPVYNLIVRLKVF